MPELVERATYSPGPSGAAGRTSAAAQPAPAPPPVRAPAGRFKVRVASEQLRAWRAFARAFSAASHVQEAALEGSRLDLSEYDVLVTLAGGPAAGMRPSDLAEHVLLTRSGMTRLVQRLEERGLLERRACPLDRRGHYIAMTAEGRHLLRRAAPGLLRGLASVLSRLTTKDLAALERAAGHITEASIAHSRT